MLSGAKDANPTIYVHSVNADNLTTTNADDVVAWEVFVQVETNDSLEYRGNLSFPDRTTALSHASTLAKIIHDDPFNFEEI